MQLHPAISFCAVEERHVFLDLDHDRYFCLGAELEAVWRAFLGGASGPAGAERLAQRGLVVAGHGRAPAACRQTIAETSLLDEPATPPSPARMLALAWELMRMRRALRRQGLGGPAATLGAIRRGETGRCADRSELTAIARDFERLGLILSAHDLCLPRSLALGLHLARSGFAPEVVLGVRLGPFRAHCWVECAGVLVNDRFERVRHYTPIRRL
jgi:hypothetical protein